VKESIEVLETEGHVFIMELVLGIRINFETKKTFKSKNCSPFCGNLL